METLEDAIDAVARETGFSGVVRIDGDGGTLVAKAYGLADRAHEIPMAIDSRLGLASGTKGLTALAVMSLIEDGSLTLATTARAVLGTDLPLIDDAVTVEQLLAHRSGIGDYLDEEEWEDVTDYVLPVPVHAVAATEQYVAVLDGHATAFQPDERFAYNNGGYVVLALIAERAGGVAFHELVHQRVCGPAGMVDTEFLRSDELPGRAAVGYLTADGPRTNVHHLPVRGTGDGGVYSTAADLSTFWRALFDGRIVSEATVAEMVRPRSEAPEGPMRYGLGFWLRGTGDVVELHGYDAGVSFRSVHDPATGATQTVISNTSEGTWPIEELLDERSGL